MQMLSKIIINIKLEKDHLLPKYATKHSVAMDLYARINNETKNVVLRPGERRLVSAGFAMELPEGYEAQIRPRSGLALKNGISLVNSPGTIDSDYRGDVGVILINHGSETVLVLNRSRIAQMVIAPITKCEWEMVKELSETERGEGGFGHTGHE